MLLSFQYFVYNIYLVLHTWKDNKIILYLVSCILYLALYSIYVSDSVYSTSFSCWRNVISQYKTTEQHSVWHTSDSFSVTVQTKDRSSYLSFFKLMSTSYRNAVKLYSMLSGIKSPLSGIKSPLSTLAPSGVISEYVSPYIPTHTPEEYWSDHMQTPGWQPILCVAWCLIWHLQVLKKYGHTWHRMSLLRPGL